MAVCWHSNRSTILQVLCGGRKRWPMQYEILVWFGCPIRPSCAWVIKGTAHQAYWAQYKPPILLAWRWQVWTISTDGTEVGIKVLMFLFTSACNIFCIFSWRSLSEVSEDTDHRQLLKCLQNHKGLSEEQGRGEPNHLHFPWFLLWIITEATGV